jgi:hypothetical protein
VISEARLQWPGFSFALAVRITPACLPQEVKKRRRYRSRLIKRLIGFRSGRREAAFLFALKNQMQIRGEWRLD